MTVPEYEEEEDTGGDNGVDTGGDRGVDPGAGGSATYTVKIEEEATTLQVTFGLSRSHFAPSKQTLISTRTGFNPIENTNLSDGNNTPIDGDDPSVPQGGASV